MHSDPKAHVPLSPRVWRKDHQDSGRATAACEEPPLALFKQEKQEKKPPQGLLSLLERGRTKQSLKQKSAGGGGLGRKSSVRQTSEDADLTTRTPLPGPRSIPR